MGLANNRKKENVFYMSLRFLEMLFIITRDGTIRDKSSDKSENNDIISSGSKQPSTVKHKKAIYSVLSHQKSSCGANTLSITTTPPPEEGACYMYTETTPPSRNDTVYKCRHHKIINCTPSSLKFQMWHQLKKQWISLSLRVEPILALLPP